jgi:hypothetical protein
MMAGIHPANDKLREAECFYFLMQTHRHEYEFKYLVSAFLSALSSGTEHNRLHSSDARFKDWYRDVMEKIYQPSVLPGLAKLRNKEIHQKGTETLQRIGFATGNDEPIETTDLEFTMDFRQGLPVGTIKTAEMAEAQPIQLTSDWVWDAPDNPDVFKLAWAGLEALRVITTSRDRMNFPD